jgi:hypothetical protein
MKCKTLVVLTFLFVSSTQAEVVSGGTAVCETSGNCTGTSGTASTTPTGTVTDQMAGAVTKTTNYGTEGTVGQEGTGAYTQAKAGKEAATAMAVVAGGFAVYYGSKCGLFNEPACLAAMAAGAAAAYALLRESQSQVVMSSLGNDGSTEGTEDTTTAADSPLVKSLNKVKADLVTQGYSVDDNGNIKMPNGSTVDADLNPQSLSAAGMSSQDISRLQNDLANMRKEMNQKAGAGAGDVVAQSVGSTGYGRVSISSLDRNAGKEATAAPEAERTGIDRDPAAWDGFFKKHGDGVIGVAHSDIFLMVEKRVDRERTGMGH